MQRSVHRNKTNCTPALARKAKAAANNNDGRSVLTANDDAKCNMVHKGKIVVQGIYEQCYLFSNILHTMMTSPPSHRVRDLDQVAPHLEQKVNGVRAEINIKKIRTFFSCLHWSIICIFLKALFLSLLSSKLMSLISWDCSCEFHSHC